jgi:hypothetical protein
MPAADTSEKGLESLIVASLGGWEGATTVSTTPFHA